MLFSPPCPPPQKPITIFVHGTRGSAFLPTKLFPKIQEIEDTFCNPPKGLHKAGDIDKQYTQRILAKLLAKQDSADFPLEDFYIFGWSGDLDIQARKEAGYQLYETLKKLHKTITTQEHCEPIFTIITHSHGGNVALYAAQAWQEARSPFSIDRLILLACPVQHETKHLISSDFFPKIYSIFSLRDTIQVLDPQWLHPFKDIVQKVWKQRSFQPFKQAFKTSNGRPLFSSRIFDQHPKLVQLNVQWQTPPPWSQEDINMFGSFANFIKKSANNLDTKQRGLLHIEFILPSFIKQLPNLLRTPVSPDNKYETVYLVTNEQKSK